MRAADIWERWFVATVLAPALGRGRAVRRMAELAEIRDRILTEATIAPTADVLDLGCGTGMLTFPAGEEAGHAVGLDRDAGLLAAATGVPALGASFVAGDATALPFADERFDVVVWRGLLAYAPDRDAILREAGRVMRPEARLAFSESLTGEMDVPATDPQIRKLWEALREIGAAAMGSQAPTQASLEAVVEHAGFEGVRVQVERRRTALEDERAVREIFDAPPAGAGSVALAGLWRAAGVPDQIVDTFLDALVAQTPMQIVTPEGYATAMKPKT